MVERCSRFALAAVLVALGLATAIPAAAAPFKATKMIIEFNASAEDIGIQFFLDAEEWQTVKIFDPHDTLIFNATASGSVLTQGGGTELFVESVEPALDELPLEEFFARFPEGQYRFVGRTPDGGKMSGKVMFTHNVPEGPEIIAPPQSEGSCPTGVAIPAVISWEPVEESIAEEPIDIVGYEVIVERGDEVFDIKLPGDATQVTVPAEFLVPGAAYIFEVLAIESGLNQTITEGCFTTAP